jgi:hypothetical protein
VVGISSGSAARHAALADYHKPIRSAGSELGQLGERRQDPHLTRTEVHDHCGVVLGQDDPAEAELIVGHLVVNSELLSRRIRGRGVEGTCGQETPGSGAGRVHHYQYAPFQPQPLISPEARALASATGR